MDDQIILASEENFGNVTVCPGGVVHVNLAHLSLKFVPSDFAKFSNLISKARLKFDAAAPEKGKPRLHLVSGDDRSDESDKSKE